MEIELRTFANFRDAVGQKTVHREYDASSVRTVYVLSALQEEYPTLELFEDDGTLQEFITVLKDHLHRRPRHRTGRRRYPQHLPAGRRRLTRRLGT